MKEKSEVFIKLFAFTWIIWFLLPLLFLLVGFFARLDAAEFVFTDSRFWAAFWISLVSAFVVVVLSLFFAIPTAYLLTYREFRFKNILETLLIDIPQTLPPVAVGVIYLYAFGSDSPANLVFTFAAVIIAKLIVASPFILSHILRKFREIKESELDLIARSLGAGTRDVLFRVLIPIAKRDIAAGLTLTWARAMGEFGGTLVFAGVIAYKTEILPTYTNRIVGQDPFLALAATIIMVFFALAAIVAVKSIIEKKPLD